jgi:putative transposase
MKYHVVFCPKYRRELISDSVGERLKNIVSDVCESMQVDMLEIETMPDHVHMLLEVDPQYGIHRELKRIKGVTSRYLRQEFQELRTRLPALWTNSYFVSTVGGALLAKVKQYIENQKHA